MAATCLALITLNANANLLTNGSFELGSFVNQGNQTMSLAAGAANMTGWTVVGRSLAWINTGNPFVLSAQDGNFFLDLTDYNAGAPFGGVTQSIPTVLGQQYTLSFELGSYTQRWGRAAGLHLGHSGRGQSSLHRCDNQHEVDLDAVFADVYGHWRQHGYHPSGSAGVQYIGLDNVRVDAVGGATVPEPASYALLALALVGFSLIARWRSA